MSTNKDSEKADKDGKLGKLTTAQHGTYLEGKRLTAKCSSWILSTASPSIKIRYNLMQTSSATTNNRSHACENPARPAFSAATKGVRPSLYLPVIRDIIAENPQLQVPPDIVVAFRDVARFRHMCCAWCKNSSDKNVQRANEGHRFFVQVLEHAYQLLVPYLAQLEDTPSVSQNEGAGRPLFENTFDVLDTSAENQVEECPADRPTEISIEKASSHATDPLEVSDSGASRAEYRRACLRECLLHDVRQLMQTVHQKWRDHKAGRLALVTVGNLTNLACNLVHQLETDFFKAVKIDPTSENLYNVYLAHLAGCACDARTSTSASPPVANLFDSSKAFGRCGALVWYARKNIQTWYFVHDADFRKQLLGTENATTAATQEYRGSPKKVFISQELIENFRQAYPHTFRIGTGTGPPSPLDGEVKELLEVFHDCLGPCTKQRSCHSAREDNLLKFIRAAVAGGLITLTSAWALQAFVDIRKIMGRAHTGTDSVDVAAMELEEAVARNILHWQRVRGPEMEDIPQYLEDLSEYASKIRRGESWHSNDRGWPVQYGRRKFLKASPHACAVLVAELQGHRTLFSAKSVDGRSTVRAFLHFYNAALQMGNLQSPWRDMERLIEWHGKETLFNGKRASNLEEALSALRFAFPLSLRLNALYPNRRDISRRTQGGLFFPYHAPLLTLLNRAGDKSGEKLTNVRLFLECSQGQLIVKDDNNVDFRDRNLLERSSAKRHLKPLEFLALTETQIRKETCHHSFNYLSLEHRCSDLLDEVAMALEQAKAPTMDMEYTVDNPENYPGYKEYENLVSPLLLLAWGTDGTGGQASCGSKAKKHSAIEEHVGVKDGALRQAYDIVVDVVGRYISQHGDTRSRVRMAVTSVSYRAGLVGMRWAMLGCESLVPGNRQH